MNRNECDETFPLEQQIYEMLDDASSDAGRENLLDRIARDETTRDLLAEIIETRRAAREALGLEDSAARDALRESMSRFEANLTSGRLRDAAKTSREQPKPKSRANAPRSGSGRPFRVALRKMSLLVRIAAVVVIVLSVSVTAMLYRDHQRMQHQIENLAGQPKGDILTHEDIQEMMALYNTAAMGMADDQQPVVSGNGGKGQIRYITTDSEVAHQSPLALACTFVDEQGQTVGQTRMVLPPKQNEHVSADAAGEVLSLPVQCCVKLDGPEATISLRMHRDGQPVAGLLGRLNIGKKTEIGQIFVNGQRVRVIAEILTLEPQA